jgi:hypothetical protein
MHGCKCFQVSSSAELLSPSVLICLQVSSSVSICVHVSECSHLSAVCMFPSVLTSNVPPSVSSVYMLPSVFICLHVYTLTLGDCVSLDGVHVRRLAHVRRLTIVGPSSMLAAAHELAWDVRPPTPSAPRIVQTQHEGRVQPDS